MIYRRDEDLIARHIAGETLLVPIRGDLAGLQRIFALQDVAEYIWRRLDGQTDLDTIRDGIMDEFEVNEERAQADLQVFIAELLQAGLIRESC
jgi:hypothetical protein